MKKLLRGLAIAALMVVAGVFVFRLFSPEIRIDNRSARIISEVVIRLPSSGVSFGPIQGGTESVIYYSARQREGRYAYSVRFESGEDVQDACGHVAPSEFGKRLRLVVRSADSIDCQEGNKVF